MTENPVHWQLYTTVVESHDPFSPEIDNITKLEHMLAGICSILQLHMTLTKLPKDLFIVFFFLSFDTSTLFLRFSGRDLFCIIMMVLVEQ
jgi:hypothetical protein